VALEAGQLTEALTNARLWASLRPGDQAPVEAIALVLVEQGNIDGAEHELTALLEKDSAHRGLTYRRIADMLGRRRNSAASMELMQRLVALHKDSPDAYYALAYLADRNKQADLVISALENALRLRPDWEEAALAKIAHYSVQKRGDELVAFADKFLAENPSANKFRLHYARYLAENNDNKKALDQFEALSRLDPNNADAAFAAGYLSLQLDNYDSAEKYLKLNLKLRPENNRTRIYLGQLASERKRYDEAARWYGAVNEDDSDNYFDAQLLLATMIAKTGGVDAAIRQLDELKPNNEEEYVRVTLSKEQVFREFKDLTRAKSVLDSAVQSYPENTDLLYARGLIAAQLQMIDVHEHDMRKLLKKDPKNAHALNALGYTLADSTNRYDEAYKLIQTALSIRPEDPFILDSMGWVQYRMGNTSVAIQYLERALSKREDAEIAAHLGEVLWVSGEQQRAREVWGKALKKYPKNDVLLSTIEKLKQ
jgi:tetratricopeptide (TPR) repeat protein